MSHARVEVSDDELDAIGDELVGDRDALLRIGDVVAEHELDLLAIDAAGRVDVGCRLLCALLELCAEGCVRTGQRAGNADQSICRGDAAHRHEGGKRNCGHK